MSNINDTTKALAVFVVLIGVAFGIFFLTNNHDSKPAGSQAQQQESAATNPVAEYDNFDSLIDYGLSSTQLTLTEQATADFVKKNDPKAKTVSVQSDSIQTLDKDPDSTIFSLSYPLHVDQTVYTARLDYIGLHAVQLYINDQAGTQVFDSGLLQGSDD